MISSALANHIARIAPAHLREDAAQVAQIAAWQAEQKGQPENAAARNEVIDFLRCFVWDHRRRLDPPPVFVEISRILHLSSHPCIGTNWELYRCMEAALRTLTLREEQIIRQVFGIGTPHLTMRSIAELIGVDESRISQIVKEALAKLRHSSRIWLLKDFTSRKGNYKGNIQ